MVPHERQARKDWAVSHFASERIAIFGQKIQTETLPRIVLWCASGYIVVIGHSRPFEARSVANRGALRRALQAWRREGSRLFTDTYCILFPTQVWTKIDQNISLQSALIKGLCR